jgi:replicative DNA helicase
MRRTDKDGKIRLTEAEIQKVTEAVGFIDAYPGKAFWVDTSQTVEDIKAKTRKLKRTHGLDGIIVDYLGIIPPSYPREIRREQVAHSIRYLEAIAKELNIPVIVLAQINRGVETRQD